MPQIKLIALDLDGTLLNENKEITPRTRAALERAAEEGIEIVPATGRFYSAMPAVVRDLPFVHYAITINGAQVYDFREERAIYEARIPLSRALSIMDHLRERSIIYDCYVDNLAFMTKDYMDHAEEHTDEPYMLYMIRTLRTPVPHLETLIRERGSDIQKISAFTSDQVLRHDLLDHLPDIFPDIITSSSISTNVEINDKRAHKGLAIGALAQHIGIRPEETMAFGDGLNDIEMLRSAGIGVAMENACDGAKEAADRITLDNEHDGVAAVVEELLSARSTESGR